MILKDYILKNEAFLKLFKDCKIEVRDPISPIEQYDEQVDLIITKGRFEKFYGIRRRNNLYILVTMSNVTANIRIHNPKTFDETLKSMRRNFNSEYKRFLLAVEVYKKADEYRKANNIPNGYYVVVETIGREKIEIKGVQKCPTNY